MAKCSCCCCNCGHAGTGEPGSGRPVAGEPPTGGGSLPFPLPRVSTWLLIRYDAADMGARPIPASDVWWESPDIWLTGGDLLGNPIGGQPANVFARVWNLGTLVATPVFVDFFFIAPSLGILPSAPERIGKRSACVLVPPLSAVVVPCPTTWIPPATEGNLHACLIATCSAPISGDVPTVPFNAVADRHTAQHNLTVLEGGVGNKFPFTIHLSNLEPLVTRFELMAAASWQPQPRPTPHGFSAPPSVSGPVNAILQSPQSPEHRLWARRAAILLERSSESYSLLSADEVRQALSLSAVTPGEINRSAAVVAPAHRFGAVGSWFTALGDAIELHPQQQATATFSVTVPNRGPHPWFIVHLAQASGSALVGGYTVAIQAA
jgi:hypothetical protein